MAYRQLCLLLLLSSYTVAQGSTDNTEQTSACLLGSRFKVHRKYVYQYTTESRNGVVGTANLRNGPKVTCQVEIEVPQMCRFILHTRHCALSEVSVMDPQGQPVYGPAPGSDAFKASMEKNPLKFSVEDETHLQLYPETDETVNILNIKRGIVSALLVPLMENGQSGLVSTVHGRCSTTYVVNSQQDVATDVTLSRDLSQCDQFYGRELTNSPLALLQKLHNPLSKLITSSQSCNYLFDNKGKHITSAMCTERHVYLPFSHRENGISSVVTQELSFQSVTRHSNRVFDVDQDQAKFLHFEEPDDKAPVQTKDAVLSTFQELVALTGTDQGQKRTGLFYKLVSGMRVLRNETLSQTVADMADVSPWLTFQALIQCGTPECTSAIMQVIWTIDGVSLEVDALVYGLSLQADPDAARVRDMLSMAQYRQSKAIMYALANTVKKFHKGEVTPVVTDVSKFMEMLLNDCSEDIRDIESDFPPDPKEMSFLVLRVVGVMGQAMQDVSPGLISAVLQCAKKTDIALSNQKAAIQALRLMDINDEIRAALMEVYLDPQSPVEKRLAAYLVMMKNPDQTLLREVLTSLMKEKDEQLRSFVISHLNNIRDSDEPQMLQLQEDIETALQGSLSPTDSVFEGLSRNYKINSPLGFLQSNIILDGKDTLPKEMMLEATLKAFDYNYDLFEVGVEGRGFQPTIDSLFGEKGFFPESISRLVYLAGDSAPMLKDVLDKISPRQDRMKRQVSEDHLKGITESFQKLVNNVRFSPTPEATAYLRLLGDEIGYLKTSEMRKMFETLFMYYHVYIRVLPAQAFFKLTSSTENEFFFHYIFMENAFSLPTAAGFPLKFSLSGLFAPGAKGGFTPSSMTDLSFMPSVGLEFITQMGVHIPDYVDAGIEMHTNMYHESSINAKFSVNRNQVKLSVPAPKSNFQLLSISNKLLSVSAGQTKIVPSLVEDRVDSTDCQPLFSGLNLCTKVRYSNATSVDRAPYYPLSGETTFAVEIQPTGKVSEYTATITDETLREGKKGRNRVESLKLTLRAEGEESVEASASLKYNHNKNLISADVVVPGYDVEAGIKLAVTDGDYEGKKMRGITIDVTNKNIPQLTLVGRVRLDQMKEAMLQLQMEIPSLKTDASVTAVLKRDEDVLLDFETVVHIPESSYQHSASLKYDDDKFEVELKTDLNSDIQKLIPSAEEHHRQLQKLIDDILDQKVAKTDMKLRHIVSKGIVAGNIWLDKLTERFPSLANLRSKRSLSDLTLPALPEKLFLHSDSLLRYQFNKDKIIISLPLPLGGKNSEEMNIPMSLSLPAINLPQIGLNIPANKYSLPSFTVPPSLDFTVPLLGLAEASTKIQSNLYSWEGSISGGNDTVDVPSYIVQYKAVAQSPLNLLSYKLEGIGMISGRPDDNLKYLLNSSFSHSLIDTSFSVLETLRVSNKLNARANYKFEASSPLGLHTSLYYSAQSTSTPDSDEVSGDGTVDGLLKFGSFHTNTSYTHSYNLRPLDREGRGESTMHFDSPFIQFHNMIQGAYANSELNVISKTTAMRDIFKHVAELKYKDAQLTLKCNAVGTVMDKSLNNKVELGVSSQMSILRIESQADDDTNRIYSLITGSLDSNGLEVNSEGSLTFDAGRALHKATVRAGRDGLTFGGTNNIQCSPVTMENIFNGAIDINGASLSSTTKAMAEESRGQLNIEGKITASEASLNGELKGHSYDATTTNIMNIVLNRRALTFNGNTKGTLRQIKTESSHTLILTLWTFDLKSNTDNFICDDIYYKQHTKINMKPFVMALDMTNDLKLYDLSMNNEGHLKLEPVKADLSGSVMGAYGDKHNIKHTYELTYNEMAGSVKYSTSGTVMDAQLSHNCELEFAGLSSTSKCDARLNSEPLRFNGSVRTMALPFSLNIDALVSSDGKVNLLGKHTGQLYSKLLVKAAPLALACSHECRVSTTHTLPSGESSTSLENKFEGLLTPKDQSLDWKVNSKMNNHGYEQDLSAYNGPEKAGIEFSGVMQTDIVSRYKRSTPETEKFSVAGFLKYDKNSNCHIIEIPFIESIPVAFEQLKSTLVQALESFQQFIHNLNINQLIKDFRDNIDQVPIHVKNFMQIMDLENKVNQVKDKLDYFIAEFAVTMGDFELAMENLRQNVEATVMDIVTKVRDLISTVEEHIKAGHLADKITNVLTYIGAQLQAFEEKYKIKQSFVRALIVLEDVIRQIDLQKLKESSVAFLQELDSKYGIMETIKEKLSELKQVIQDLSPNQLLEDVKNYLLSFDWASYIEQLSYQIPASEIAKVLESMKDVIVNWIDEYEIPQKINAVIDYFKAFILKHELDIISKDLMDQAVTLVKEFKIEETVQSVVDALKSIKFEFVYDKIIKFLHTVKNQLQAIDFKKSIGDINEHISSTLELMKEFDYNAFVDETNVKIAQLTKYINDEIEKYEIVQKIEALREFFREIQNSIFKYLDELKNTKVADALKKLKEVIDTAFYNDIKLKMQDILEDMRQRILDMDIRNEIYIHLQRISESYSNIVAYISAQFTQLMEKISEMANNNKIINQIKQAVNGVLDELQRAEIEFPTFTVPLTDLEIPAFTINLNKLKDIQIPAQISVPEFTILDSYTIPAFTIDFEELKAKIVAIIDDIKAFEIQTPDPVEIFGDLKVLYLFKLPDLTLPEITLLEIKFPAISIPKLNMEDFEITMLSIPDITLPEIPSDVCIPAFGKLHGEFTITSPQYTLVTTGKIENSTSTLKNPQFTATIASHAKSPIEPLEFTFEANAQLEAPKMKKLLFKETVKATHMAFAINHEGSLTFTGSSVEASAKTTAKATTQMYTADLTSNMALSLQNGLHSTIATTYSHNLDIPSMETSSQVSIKHNIAASKESGKITVTGQTNSNGKWSVKDYSDEGTHKSNIEFTVDFSTAKLTFEGETGCKALKMKQTLFAESVILSHIIVDATCETETPSIKKSIMVLNGEAHIGDLKAVLTASHSAEFTESLTGSVSNLLEFKAHPFEIILDVKNKVTSKLFFPLKLTGKVDLQYDYGVVLNSEKQRAFWVGSARFNQYKYSHNITAENNEMNILFHSSVSGEANLDFLTIPLSIPEMTIPHLETKTPEVTDFSLWEHTGLKSLLITPQQSFDMNLKLQYSKNPDMHSFELHLEPIYNAISDNAKILQIQFEVYRDKVVAFLKDSYNEAKSQYIKHKIDTSSLPPRIFRVPGYTIPVLNIQVSSFSAEMPAFTYFVPKEVSTPSFKVPALGFSVPSYTLVLPSLRLPVLHVPDTLSEIRLPAFTLPAVQDNIVIPAIGNITCDFSFKSTVITLSANAGFYNESDIVARFGASSVSVFDTLNGKIDGTTSLTRTRGLKLATIVSLEHKYIEANHECAVSLNKRSLEASIANSAKIDLPFLKLEFSQELTGNTKTKPNVSSKKKLRYMFNIPLVESVGKGNLDINWELETLLSHVSLEMSTEGKSDITIMDNNFVGDLLNRANFYLNANSLRSTATTALKVNMDEQEKQKRSSDNNFLFDLDNNLALEVSLRRVFATFDYTSNNIVDLASLETNGKHLFKGELDFVPLTAFRTTLMTEASQMSGLGNAEIVHNINLAIGYEKQTFSWTGKEQLGSFTQACDLSFSNDESEIRMDLAGSVEGHLAFLKSIQLPVYQRFMWDVLKFDEVTRMDNLQSFKISSSVVYTKSMDGYDYAIPTKLFENGVTFSIPEISIAMPSWVKEIPQTIKNIDMRFENVDVPDHLTLPPEISVPAFEVPFTNLHVESFTVDPKNLDIPEVITTKAFDIMLPGIPVISVPSYDINTKHLQGKMSFLLFKIPQYEITMSSFMLPTSFTIGEHTISLNDITNQISNFQFPNIIIPEQKIEIPETALYLPSSVFIPTFGALSATLNVSTPIYNVSTSTNMEKKNSNLITSLYSFCTSTMIFLEYELTAKATLGYDNEVLNLNGNCKLAHSDINVDWQHILTRSLRTKRQVSRGDSTNQESRHTLNIDVTSRSFADVSFRFASRKDGITASILSPSAGFLGLHLQRRSPSQLVGKLFSRYMSTPDKDTNVFTAKASLRNSEKLVLQTSWNWGFFNDLTEGVKNKIPAMTNAVLVCINKYHTAHFGFDLNRGSMKLKSSVSNVIERAFHKVSMYFTALRDVVQILARQGKDIYSKASDVLMSMNVQDLTDMAVHQLKQVINYTHDRIKVLVDAVTQILSGRKFTVPGSDRKLTIMEMFQRAQRSISKATDRAIQRFFTLMGKISAFIRNTEFTILGTDVVVNGDEIMDKLQSFLESAYGKIQVSMREGVSLLYKAVNGVFQIIAEKAEELLTYLKDKNLEMTPTVDNVYAEVVQSSRQHSEEAKRCVAEYKDLVKLKIHQVYNSVNVELVNSRTKEFISILQSNLSEAFTDSVDLMKRASQSTAPYVRVSNEKVDVEIPLPFLWKSFSEWPTQFRQ
ncbi:apolipoprotein B-100 [Melanotaenia boesemani]|uniref:apolipoprotein B-100 n=1 Tax=Melanotaenia boesemani TaxID=1250792 RepID=UPI001C05A60D|nr:apolipoprotein B-100 [Melanotaenia boesemani]